MKPFDIAAYIKKLDQLSGTAGLKEMDEIKMNVMACCPALTEVRDSKDYKSTIDKSLRKLEELLEL